MAMVPAGARARDHLVMFGALTVPRWLLAARSRPVLVDARWMYACAALPVACAGLHASERVLGRGF
jgi:hypothetical protein